MKKLVIIVAFMMAGSTVMASYTEYRNIQSRELVIISEQVATGSYFTYECSGISELGLVDASITGITTANIIFKDYKGIARVSSTLTLGTPIKNDSYDRAEIRVNAGAAKKTLNGIIRIYDKNVNSSGNASVNLKDETGTSYGVKQIDGKPRVSAMSYLHDIAEGNVPSHDAWSKIGYNGDVDAGTEDMISQGGVYAFRVTASAMTIVSSSDNDGKTGSPSSTGVRTVTLYYLTDTFVEKQVVVTLNGTTPVATSVSDIYRVNNLRVTTCGSNNSAVGNITLATGGVTYGYIMAGQTRGRQCVYTVPKDKVLYVTSIAFSIGGTTKEKAAVFTTLAKYDNLANTSTTFFLPCTEVIMEDNQYVKQLEVPERLGEGTDLKVQIRGLVADCVTSCTLRGWLEDE